MVGGLVFVRVPCVVSRGDGDLEGGKGSGVGCCGMGK